MSIPSPTSIPEEETLDVLPPQAFDSHSTAIRPRPAVVRNTVRNSDYMATLLQIPDCLSSTTNSNFEQVLGTNHLPFTSATDLETVRQICVLMHQINTLELEKLLWHEYLKSGTGRLVPNSFDLKVWPRDMKLVMEHIRLPVLRADNDQGVDDPLFVTWIQDYFLDTFEEMQQEFRAELSRKKTQLPSDSTVLCKSLDDFDRKNATSCRSIYQCRMKFVDLHFREQILECRFDHLKPSVAQFHTVKRILDSKYIYEETKEELQRIEQQRSVRVDPRPLPSAIQSIADKDLREDLSARHEHILDRYHHEMTKLLVHTWEIKLAQSEKQHNQEVQATWLNRHSLPADEQITEEMRKIVDDYFALITEQLQVIHAYKTLVLTK